MENDRLSKPNSVAVTDLATLLQIASRQRWPIGENQSELFASYRLALDDEPIQLGIIEFRILLFLASRPYHAFTRRNIAEAVSSFQNPVAEDTIDAHVVSLVDQLGAFHDYVQSVPYIGYRFKA
jgi:DNA-binding response OmpR family regulator